MTEIEKWKRITNPKTVEDWGLGVSLAILFEEDQELVIKEILPQLQGVHSAAKHRRKEP